MEKGRGDKARCSIAEQSCFLSERPPVPGPVPSPSGGLGGQHSPQPGSPHHQNVNETEPWTTNGQARVKSECLAGRRHAPSRRAEAPVSQSASRWPLEKTPSQESLGAGNTVQAEWFCATARRKDCKVRTVRHGGFGSTFVFRGMGTEGCLFLALHYRGATLFGWTGLDDGFHTGVDSRETGDGRRGRVLEHCCVGL